MAGAHVPAGEHDVAVGGHHLGIVVKSLVEIAETEQDDGVGELLFDVQVLLAEGASPTIISQFHARGKCTRGRNVGRCSISEHSSDFISC